MREKRTFPTHMCPYMQLLTLQSAYKSKNKFFKEFDSKKGFPFAGWYLNVERESMRKLVQQWK
jgi:hypothetical protein